MHKSMHSESSTSKDTSDTVLAKTSQEKLWFETLPKSSQWRRRGDDNIRLPKPQPYPPSPFIIFTLLNSWYWTHFLAIWILECCVTASFVINPTAHRRIHTLQSSHRTAAISRILYSHYFYGQLTEIRILKSTAFGRNQTYPITEEVLGWVLSGDDGRTPRRVTPCARHCLPTHHRRTERPITHYVWQRHIVIPAHSGHIFHTVYIDYCSLALGRIRHLQTTNEKHELNMVATK